MTVDLAAVCARHQVRLRQIENGRWSASKDCTITTDRYGGDEATEADAVCALLKARHWITTRTYAATHERLWEALPLHPDEFGSSGHRSELAAVVALADRLAGAAV